MRLKPKELPVTEEAPFQNDLLNRSEFADVLTKIVRQVEHSVVIGLNSPWGTGKTTFLTMWIQAMKNQGIPCVYFSAWETDFAESPLVALIAEITAGVNKLPGPKNSQAKEIVKRLESHIPVLLKVFPAILQAAAKHAGLGDVLAELLKECGQAAISQYVEMKTTIKNFREDLGELVAELPGNGSLVLVIDELDRCRPDYAIKLLEQVKHLFSVDKVVFVIGMDREQIGHSVRALYGDGMNSEGYLRRLVDVDIRLPETSPATLLQCSVDRCGIQSFGDNKESDLFAHLCTLMRFSLRDQEQCVARFVALCGGIGKVPYALRRMALFMICFRMWKPDLYQCYWKGTALPREVMDSMQSWPSFDELQRNGIIAEIEARLLAGIRNAETREQLLEDYKHQMELQPRAKQVVQAFQAMGIESRTIALLWDQLELSWQFR